VIQIVAATEALKSRWWPLWQAYLSFYEHPLPDEISDLTFARALEPSSGVELCLAMMDGMAVGFVICVYHPSSWSRNGYCYLEDLYVDEGARGRGVGRALIEAVADAARTRGCERLYWVTQEGNATARALYDRLATKNDFVTYVKPL